MKTLLMRLAGSPLGPLFHDGQYLKGFDFEAHNGTGEITLTESPEEAKQFLNLKDLQGFHLTQPKCRPLRDDGEPNRPLTATNWEVVTLETLDELMYTAAAPGEMLCLYIYGDDGRHGGRQYFTGGQIRYPEEEIPVEDALRLAADAEKHGHEVRITNGGDMLVYHSVGGETKYPKGEGIEQFGRKYGSKRG